MLDALYVAATGMQAQQLQVDTIANNLANVATPGFKKSRVSFTDLVMRQASPAPTVESGGAEAGPLVGVPRLGSGVGIAQVEKTFEQGDLKQTGSVFDVAIQGDGFLEVVMADGTRAFTRGGTLKVNADGALVTPSGQPLKPGIHLPANATGFLVASDGQVRATLADEAAPVGAGQLELVRFANPGSLASLGSDLYAATDGSGEPIPGRPGQDGLGTVVQGYQEGSNVNLTDEMVNLMIAQRAYEASVKVVQASDEMLGMVNALRK